MKIGSRRLTAMLSLLTAAMQVAICAHNLDEEYRFSAILDDGYKVHWNFDLEQQTIAFAVNVSTTGWVGFGLSPNGQMPQSDVVIGWVDEDGNTQFNDHFATDRFLPSIDKSQDWFLVSGEEENGYTILEFTRNLVTCDENDIEIKTNTARVIWAYHSIDPVNLRSLGSLRHQQMGAISLNLLGGSNEDRIVQDTSSFIIANENLSIPDKDTTYWCSVHPVPNELAQQEKYIYKFDAAISEDPNRYVHHILVYLCTNLNHTHVGTSVECDNANIDISLCRGGGTLIAAWAVGGNEFVYPKDVALPIGGEGNPQYIILEMHYDNPNEDSGVLDSSGIKFTYTNQPQRHRAGILTLGYAVHSGMIIPPGRDNHMISGFCPGECTLKFFPAEGITVFGNALHTHLAGHGLVVRQYRQNNECDVLEELQPIDENRRYDFNFQQLTHLPREVKILPGDKIEVQCFYRTTSTNNVTLGGESTRDEMCFSFLFYYPQIDMNLCSSLSPLGSFDGFVQQYIHPSLHETFYTSLLSNNVEGVKNILNQVEWTEEASRRIESLLNTNASSLCLNSRDISKSLSFETPLPSADCPYKAPNQCTGVQPQPCCKRLITEMPISAAVRQWGPLYHFLLMLSVFVVLSTVVVF